MWKAPREMSQPRGLVFSGTVTVIAVSIQRTGKHLASRGVYSKPLLFPRVRGVTPDASVSASLRFTAVVKSVQGAGLGSGLGEVA